MRCSPAIAGLERACDLMKFAASKLVQPLGVVEILAIHDLQNSVDPPFASIDNWVRHHGVTQRMGHPRFGWDMK